MISQPCGSISASATTDRRRARSRDDLALAEAEFGSESDNGASSMLSATSSVVAIAGLVDILGVRQPQRRGPGCVQPRMASAQTDQVLVQPEHIVTVLVDPIRGGEFGPYGIVAAEPFLLDAAIGRLVAGTTRGATRREQDYQRVFEVTGVLQLAGDPGDVVVADEGHRHEVVEKLVVPHQRPVELVEVAVVEAAPDRLPQLVLTESKPRFCTRAG